MSTYLIKKRGLKITITIQDEDFRVLEVFKFYKSNASQIGKLLKAKYGIDFSDKEKDLLWAE